MPVKKKPSFKKKAIVKKTSTPKPAVEIPAPIEPEQPVNLPQPATESAQVNTQPMLAPEVTSETVNATATQVVDQAPATTSVPPAPEAPSTEDADSPNVQSEINVPLSSDWGSFRKEALESGGNKLLPQILITFLVFILAVGGFLFWNSPYNPMAKRVQPTPTPMPISTITPTAEETNVSEYKIQILNGSGIAGEASKAQGNLEDQGFTVQDIGNASNSNFKDTQVAVKKDVKKTYISKLIKTLETYYSVSSELLKVDETNDADVVVTLGSNPKK